MDWFVLFVGVCLELGIVVRQITRVLRLFHYGQNRITAGEFDGTVSITLYVSGIPVADWKADISEFKFERRIKWSAAAQQLSGTFTATME